MYDNFFGLQVYYVDRLWQLKCVLLGARYFKPAFGERDAGIQGPFKASLLHILEDFGLCFHDIFGATSNGVSDVKSMLSRALELRWEWCIAHLAHVATQSA